MVSIRGNNIIKAINPSNRSEIKELSHEDYKHNVDKKIASIFNVKIESIKQQENLIKQPRGFFWDKIVRPIFGYKFDILRVKKNVRNEDLIAFHAAVAKITYEKRAEIIDIEKITEIHKRPCIEINKARINKLHEELKSELKVEEEVFEKCFQDFYNEKIKSKMQSEFNPNLESFKEDFKSFFYNRKQDLSDGIKKDLNGTIQQGLSKDVLKRFIDDATRMGKDDQYGVLNIEDSKIIFDEKKLEKSDEESKEQLETQCKNDLKTFKENLKKELKIKNVADENIEKFSDFIVYICSQTAEVDFLKNVLIQNLFRQGEQFITGFDLKKEFLAIQIKIEDDKTLKMEIQAKDPKKLFSTQKFLGLGAEDWNLAIKNPKSEITIELDKDQWKVKDGKISYQIENNIKEEK